MDERERQVDRLVGSIREWASQRPDVRAAALVGSWARRSAQMDSDIDLVLLTTNAAAYIERDGWVQELGAISVVRTKGWGVLTERRLLLPDGLEIDVGVVPPTWACTDRLDPGTKRVVTEGMVPLYDPDGLLVGLLDQVGSS